MEALGLSREPSIVDGSHVEHAKPEPDLLLLAAQRLEVDPGRCWYVGDSTWDMVAAVAAGMIAIGVTAGSAVDAQVLKGAGAVLFLFDYFARHSPASFLIFAASDGTLALITLQALMWPKR